MGQSKIWIVLSILLLGVVAYLFFNHKSERKVGYVLIRELYNGFEMKKQMEQKYLKTKQQRDKVLDSAKFELNKLLKKMEVEKEKNQKSVAEFNQKKEMFLQTRNSFEEENAKFSQQLDEQILTQLNQYVKDYGIQEQYDFLFGNDGNGSLMFATENFNRTQEVLEFINRKYNGTN